jgi:Trypsin-like peptidase domain
MSDNFSDSVVLITSSVAEHSDSFGTGFVIYQNEQATYLLSCAHVVRDVGGSGQIKADGVPATVVTSGESNGIDLAVLKIEGLLDKPPLSLSGLGEEEQSLVISGFYEFARKTPPALRDIRGKLGNQIRFASNDGRERIKAWDLKIEGEHGLQPGYSGSPVINETTGCVLGVVSHQIGKGEKGLAISIEAILKVWLEMPANLISSSSYEKLMLSMPPHIQKKIERLERDRNLAQKQSNELTEVIQAIVDEMEENRGDAVRQRNLNKRKQRYEEERNQHDQEVERIQAEIDKLKCEYS